MLAAELAFKKVTGVEFSAELNQIAQANINKYKTKKGSHTIIESICQDATLFEIPKEKAVYYFFNPFNEIVLSKVIANIKQSLTAWPRDIYILYCNPIHIDALDELAFDKFAAGDKFALFKPKAD